LIIRHFFQLRHSDFVIFALVSDFDIQTPALPDA